MSDANETKSTTCRFCTGPHASFQCGPFSDAAKAHKARLAGDGAPKQAKPKGKSRWGQRAAAPKRKATSITSTSTTAPKDATAKQGKPRPATPSEWQDLTGELLESREIVRLPGSIGGSELVLTYKAFEHLPPYVALHWEKPDAVGEMKRTRGKTLACQLPDVATMARAWALAAQEAATLPASTIVPAGDAAP